MSLVQTRHIPRAGDTLLQLVQNNKQQEDRTLRFRYYVIRCQQRALENRLNLLHNKYPNMRLLEPKCYDTNALHDWNKFKQENLTRTGLIWQSL